MKKHLTGLFIAGFAFAFGFYISPIRFINEGTGHGATADSLYDCSFSNNASNHFSSVLRWRCNYKNPETASKAFDNLVTHSTEIVEPAEKITAENGKIVYRAIIKSYHEDLQIYCLIRTDGNLVDEVSSTSLRHVREFEEQKFKH